MNNIKLLVAHHKPALVIESDVYKPLHVGRDCSSMDLHIEGDNSGDNISKLNPIFCEMTAVYWGWKNLDADYVGLCHYRRYFTFRNKMWIKNVIMYWRHRLLSNWLQPGKYTYSYETKQFIISDEEKLKRETTEFQEKCRLLLKDDSDVDAIVPSPHVFPCVNVRQFFDRLCRDHISLLENIVKKNNPDFYRYLDLCLKSHTLYAANMFVFKKKVFDNYCQTIFPVLFEHIEAVKQTGWCNDPEKEKCYSRLSGYLSELLTSSYILKLLSEDNNKVIFANTVMFA